MGQGLETVLPDVVADILGVPDDKIELRFNDLAMPKLMGTGSFGSRSLISHGGALATGAQEIVRKGREVAASELEVAADDVTFENGVYKVAGTDLSVSLQSLIEKPRVGTNGHPLDTNVTFDTAAAFPNGAHVAEVEIDLDTGVTEVVKYAAVNDFGTELNPLMVAGQVHGGLVQGIGQVLMENTVYDAEGQLLTGSFMDYAMPRATDAPSFTVESHPSPATTNALGIKGCGEAGCAGALVAVNNAIADALAEVGVKNLEMPATAERVWQAIKNARSTAA
jgi:carbon-monoxide dehydrogenase large subunit